MCAQYACPVLLLLVQPVCPSPCSVPLLLNLQGCHDQGMGEPLAAQGLFHQSLGSLSLRIVFMAISPTDHTITLLCVFKCLVCSQYDLCPESPCDDGPFEQGICFAILCTMCLSLCGGFKKGEGNKEGALGTQYNAPTHGDRLPSGAAWDIESMIVSLPRDLRVLFGGLALCACRLGYRGPPRPMRQGLQMLWQLHPCVCTNASAEVSEPTGCVLSSTR